MPKRRKKSRLARLRIVANKLEARVNAAPWDSKAFNTAAKRLATVEDQIWSIQNKR